MATKSKEERKQRPLSVPFKKPGKGELGPKHPAREVSVNEEALLSLAVHGKFSRMQALWAILHEALAELKRPKGATPKNKPSRDVSAVGTFPNDQDIIGWARSLTNKSSTLAFAFGIYDLIDEIIPPNADIRKK